MLGFMAAHADILTAALVISDNMHFVSICAGSQEAMSSS